ncbi:glycosyltransferase family 4 protein [Suillus discolor]|uniref:GDP-Man:Man(3)GlcNAc(2)-PP-Dol alpha-1,2-mannosyltransferase n=1 Tax=Suillus discolor TaxID=1912936 RepID=A0A9P7FM05_9AGAM|nr:glycosyltransferase family 4 protein [Suillus discolor]KAG2120714.1 glycosyltransferase family 4 protein [Suillus discolor]
MAFAITLLCLLLTGLLGIIIFTAYTNKLARHSAQARHAIIKNLGISTTSNPQFIGFFHPYCNAGGGGERVLWTAIAATQRAHPNCVSLVYTGDVDATKEQILAQVEARFNISLDPKSLHFVFLKRRRLVEDAAWPRFTLLGQSLGSMFLAWEALSQVIPDLYIDSMGYAFTFHVVAWITKGSIPMGAYIHYPTISTDMLARVKARKVGHTNRGDVAGSLVLSRGKMWYYRFLMYHYSLALSRPSFIMANSSWTKNHVDAILSHSDPVMNVMHFLSPLFILRLFATTFKSKKLHPDSASKKPEANIVYPPCDTREMAQFPLDERERIILSIAQFRPEKDHPAQLRAFAQLLADHPTYISGSSSVQLFLLGGARNTDDHARVQSLRDLAEKLEITPYVQFIVNASYPKMLRWLAMASIGLSTMVDEHFGINVVEFMAAGVIPVTHASGGPLHDIVVPLDGEATGFHARDPQSFANAMHTVLSMSKSEQRAMRTRARTWAVSAFAEQRFVEGWEAAWKGWVI